MKSQSRLPNPWRHRVFPVGVALLVALTASAVEVTFRHHFVDQTLPQTDRLLGDYGLTALVDIDHDGDLDFVVGGRQPAPDRLYWFEFQGADKWVRHDVGTGYQSDVGLAALDVDGDGWVDLVCSGVWFRNPGNPRDGKWERIEFAKNAAGAHVFEDYTAPASRQKFNLRAFKYHLITD